jgi:hypothetical protein
MSFKHRFAAYAAFALFASTSITALADDHCYTEGEVVNVSRIKTVDGKFDDYMKWLDTTERLNREPPRKPAASSATRSLHAKHAGRMIRICV